MVKIHWSVYIIISIVVLVSSYKLNSQTNSRDFTLFIWIGYLFLVIGIAKLGIWFINRRKESPVERKNVAGIYKRAKQRRIRYCPRCKNALQGYENFCSGCGQRVR